MDITKLNDYSIKVTEQKPLPAPDIQTYDYDFLLQQRINITRDIANMQAELDKVNNLITEAEKLGVSARPKELPPELKGI